MVGIGYMKTPPDLNDVYTGSLGETETGAAAALEVFLRGDVCSGVYF
jgi:hypothetical protein